MPTIALTIAYNGRDFHGWQRQPGLQTVQGQVEQALSKIASDAITVQCAGRTDVGVHATTQVVSFSTQAVRPIKAWIDGVNSFLPQAIRVQQAYPVPAEFHARFWARRRRYHYIIDPQARGSVFCSGLTWWHPYGLSIAAMQQAADCLPGEQNFSSFRAAACQSNSANRYIEHCQIKQYGRFIVIDIKANAFLHHMVRNIVGSLVLVGEGKKSVSWFHDLIPARDRTLAGKTAPSRGLYLVGVNYPQELGLATDLIVPDWLAWIFHDVASISACKPLSVENC